MVRFSYQAIIRESWKRAKENYALILAVFGVLFAVHFGFSKIMSIFQGDRAASSLVFIVSQVVMIFLSIGLIRCFLQAADGKKIIFSTLFSGSDVFLPFLAAHIAYILLCLLGFFLLIVPGLIWFYKYSFVAYFIADKNEGIRGAFSKSGQVTQGYKWNLLLLVTASFFINIVGLLCFGIGLFVTLPVTMMFYPVVFRLLTNERAGECSQNAAF